MTLLLFYLLILVQRRNAYRISAYHLLKGSLSLIYYENKIVIVMRIKGISTTVIDATIIYNTYNATVENYFVTVFDYCHIVLNPSSSISLRV